MGAVDVGLLVDPRRAQSGAPFPHSPDVIEAGNPSMEKLSFESFRNEVLQDYRWVCISRETSLLGRKEVLTGKAKFGIFGDGKEVAQVAMAKFFQPGDFRSAADQARKRGGGGGSSGGVRGWRPHQLCGRRGWPPQLCGRRGWPPGKRRVLGEPRRFQAAQLRTWLDP